MYVFVLDTKKNPLTPCHPSVARKLLKNRKAAILKRFPFTIILKEEKPKAINNIRIKIDPGSRTSGIVLIKESLNRGEVIWAAELAHRGSWIKKQLETRRNLRRNRRSRHTRYRKPRFLNRVRAKGWFQPSLESRCQNIKTWVSRLKKITPISNISLENVRFDTQKMVNPEISGVEYQQGELLGYEVKEYLLEKWGRKCAYCGKTGVPLQTEHIVPKSRGGSNRVSNLTLACDSCNKKKGTMTADEFGHKKIQKKSRIPLKDAAVMNSTRKRIFTLLEEFGLPIETGTGGMTKYNRHRLNFKKTHWLDAVCVGASTPDIIDIRISNILKINSMGHGLRRRCTVVKGFPISHFNRAKSFMGYSTGDIVKAIVPAGQKASGTHIGRITIRHSLSFKLNEFGGVHPKYMKIIQKSDGYGYSLESLFYYTGVGL